MGEILKDEFNQSNQNKNTRGVRYLWLHGGKHVIINTKKLLDFLLNHSGRVIRGYHNDGEAKNSVGVLQAAANGIAQLVFGTQLVEARLPHNLDIEYQTTSN